MMRHLSTSILTAFLCLTLSMAFAQSPFSGSERLTPEQRATRQTEQLKEALALSDSQTASVQAINEKYALKGQEMRASAGGDRMKMRALFQDLNKARYEEIASLLTPDQLSAWSELKAEQAAQTRQRGGAQNRGARSALSGRVVDQADGTPLPGAYLTLVPASGGDTLSAVTDGQGAFRFQGLPAGRFVLAVSFLGFETVTLDVLMQGADQELPPIKMTASSLQLGEVEVKEKVIPAIQKGDTTEFNSGAFKTNPDATAEDLIRKMPGVVVENGQIQAQGEDVKEVLVDGKPFFTNDPRAALNNLPADLIEKVQVYDRESDQAQFTGMRDTETSKTLNIITRSNMRNGQFGKIYAGYGSDERYRTGGQLSYFDGDNRLSLIGLSNNINQQNFTTEDLLGMLGSSGGSRWSGMRGGGGRPSFGGGSTRDFMVAEQNGIAQTHALGMNYNSQWSSSTKVAANYFFSNSDNDARQILAQDFLGSDGAAPTYNESSLSVNQTLTHRFNARIEHQIDSSNSIIFSPRITAQLNDGEENTLGQNFLDDKLISGTDYRFRPVLSGIDVSGDLLFRHKFSKKGRTLSVNVEGGFSENSGESSLLSQTSSFRSDPFVSIDTLDQFADLATDGLQLEGNVTYTEPAGENAMVSLSWSTDYQENETDQRTFDFAEATQGYDQLNPLLSTTFQSEYTAHRAGIGYQYRGKKLILNSRLNMQYAELSNDQAFPTEFEVSKVFRNILPSAFLRYEFSKQENLRLAWRTRTRAPSADQLQEVIDNRNPLQLSTGNPDLKQAFENRFFIRYSKTMVQKGRVFYALIGGSVTDNVITNSTILASRDTILPGGIAIQRGARLLRPVNLDGAWNVRSFLTYGLPAAGIKSNLNFNVSASFIREPGLLNDVATFSNTTTGGLGISLSSNISEKVDFRISSRSNFNRVTNSLNADLNNNFFTQSTDLSLNLIFGPGLVFRTNLSHQYFGGLSDEVDTDYLLWNAGVAKKLFKNDRGEIQISVFDILKQNTSINRTVTEVLVEDSQTNVLQQYVMLTFTWQLRNFTTGQSASGGRPGMDWRGGRPQW